MSGIPHYFADHQHCLKCGKWEGSPDADDCRISDEGWEKERIRELFISAAELVAAEQHGLSCLALRHVGTPARFIANYREWLGEPDSHLLWMKFGDVHNKEARAHRVTALLLYAETL